MYSPNISSINQKIEKDSIIQNRIPLFREEVKYHGEEAALHDLFQETKPGYLRKNPLLIERWRDAINYYLKQGNTEKIDTICVKLSENDETEFRKTILEMISTFTFSLVGVLTIDCDYAHETKERIIRKINDSRIKRYRNLLITMK